MEHTKEEKIYFLFAFGPTGPIFNLSFLICQYRKKSNKTNIKELKFNHVVVYFGYRFELDFTQYNNG